VQRRSCWLRRMRCQEVSGAQTSTVYQKRRTGYIAGKWQLLARQRSGRPCRSLVCLELFAERGATLAGAGPASQDGGGSRLRGALGGRSRAGRLGKAGGECHAKGQPQRL